MSIPTGPDPIDRLHAADPIQADDVPDASLARVAARIQEHIMTDKQHDPTVRQPRGPLVWVGGLALFGVVRAGDRHRPRQRLRRPDTAAGRGDPDPVRGTGRIQRSGRLRQPGRRWRRGLVPRLRPGEPAQLRFGLRRDRHRRRRRPGHVQGERGLEGRRRQHHADRPAGRHRDLRARCPTFTVGGRYLVTASGSTISACGYTLDYDADTAATWAAAFGS